MQRVITCNCRTMHLADPAHSEHDTFSCWPLKNKTRHPIQPLYSEELYNTIFKIEVSFTSSDGQTYPANPSFFKSKWPFSNRRQGEREFCRSCYQQVVNSFFDMESSKVLHVKRKIVTCRQQWHDPFSHYAPLKMATFYQKCHDYVDTYAHWCK